MVVVVDEAGDGTVASAPSEENFFFFLAACSPHGATRFLRCVFQTFLISLSVRPGRHAAILDHLRG
jgi:hypothetical protein